MSSFSHPSVDSSCLNLAEVSSNLIRVNSRNFTNLDFPTPLSPIIKIFRVVRISPSSMLLLCLHVSTVSGRVLSEPKTYVATSFCFLSQNGVPLDVENVTSAQRMQRHNFCGDSAVRRGVLIGCNGFPVVPGSGFSKRYVFFLCMQNIT